MSEGLCLTNLATGNPNLDPYQPENEIQTLKNQCRELVSFQMKRSLYNITIKHKRGVQTEARGERVNHVIISVRMISVLL
jgi:hypothetical protein